MATQIPPEENLPDLQDQTFDLLRTHQVFQRIPNSFSFELSRATLSSSTVYEIYKNVSLEELPQMRKLVNPNQRNPEEKSALAIAEEKKDNKTITKLHLAGALPKEHNLLLGPERKKDKTRLFEDSDQNYMAFFEPYIESEQIAKGAKRFLKNYHYIPISERAAIKTIISQRTQQSFVLYNLKHHLPGKLPPAQLAAFFEQKIEKSPTNIAIDDPLKARLDFLKSAFLQRS